MTRAATRACGILGLVVTGVVGVMAAVAATTVVAAGAKAAGVDFEIPEGGDTIPLAGFAFMAGMFSLVGVGLAAALLRWSARPADRFVWTTVGLATASLIAPLVSGASAATIGSLLVLHVVPAAIVIPVLGRALRARETTGARTIA